MKYQYDIHLHRVDDGLRPCHRLDGCLVMKVVQRLIVLNKFFAQVQAEKAKNIGIVASNDGDRDNDEIR